MAMSLDAVVELDAKWARKVVKLEDDVRDQDKAMEALTAENVKLKALLLRASILIGSGDFEDELRMSGALDVPKEGMEALTAENKRLTSENDDFKARAQRAEAEHLRLASCMAVIVTDIITGTCNTYDIMGVLQDALGEQPQEEHP